MPRHAWQKGESGNPNGRPRAQVGAAARVARAIQALTNDCDDLIKVLLSELKADEHGLTDRQRDRRIKVAELLLDRALGKPQQEIVASIAPSTNAPIPLASMTPAALDALEIALAPLAAEIIAQREDAHVLPDPDPAPTP